MAIMPAQQRRTEAHRKAQHLDAATARHPEVAELVKRHQDAKRNHQPDDHIKRTHRYLQGLSITPTQPTCGLARA
jgi:hypothetical protein